VSIPVIAFFNNKGGVGKTTLVYHLAWMLVEHGLRVVAADLDPQANLSAAFLDEGDLEVLWSGGEGARGTIFGSVEPFIRGLGDVGPAHLQFVGEDQRLALLTGDLALSSFEDKLSAAWPGCADGDEAAFRVTSAFGRLLQDAAKAQQADVVLLDLGPNLGAINRAAMIASDFLVTPLAPDLFSLQGLKNLGPTLRMWRELWKERLKKNPSKDLILPKGKMAPIGYVVLQHSQRLDRPVKAYDRWMRRIPEEYRESVLDETGGLFKPGKEDPYRLASLKHYRSLMPMAQEVRKPIFHLKPADGAIGSHALAVQEAYQDFKRLAEALADKTGLQMGL
jgi:chromosome partitioning protein